MAQNTIGRISAPGDRPGRIFLGGGGENYREPQELLLKYANRHGLIAGATGTGKTVTLQIMAEAFSRAGTPVFLADVKGDLSGLAKAGSEDRPLHPKLVKRADQIGLTQFEYEAAPVEFWDLFGEQGCRMRASVSAIGPLALSQLLDLNEVQEGVLNVVFRAAKDADLPLVDLKDLRAMLQEVARNARSYATSYGNVSAASVGAIQRRLLVLENQGADLFFGEPGLELGHIMRADERGRGVVNILAADKLMRSPRLYATFLFWLLTQLFEQLPEVGDPEKPVLAFFFDEAHLLFDDAPKPLIDQIEQVARLIRSKGVGVYFVTQNPADVPDDVLGQLGNRVQHALRAFTPKDRKALRAASETFRPNPSFKTDEAITALGVGEALVSVLEARGVPSIVEKTLIRPPASQIGPLTAAEREKILAASPMKPIYEKTVDRHSAFEVLSVEAEAAAKAAADELERTEKAKAVEKRDRSYARGSRISGRKAKSRRQTTSETFFKSVARRIGSKLGDRIMRGIFGR
ncbi:MAG: DUF853 domain-containing protein [Neomegalonema sp.]|nr:DUF853 domain-containing protein [Neomegalonema sp.]